MSRKAKILIIAAVSVVIISAAAVIGIVFKAFDAQYNSNGVSSLLVITIDEKQPKEFVGRLDGYNVYVERLKTDDLYFISVDVRNIPLKEAIEKELVHVDDWRKKAWNVKKDGDAEILQYENYEIAVVNGDCVIRPKSPDGSSGSN